MPDSASAVALAENLVKEGLAACVNVLAACTSVYRWQGKMETAQEVPVLIKAVAANYSKIENFIQQNHPYELPEIIAVSITHGSSAYLNWLVTETSMDIN